MGSNDARHEDYWQPLRQHGVKPGAFADMTMFPSGDRAASRLNDRTAESGAQGSTGRSAGPTWSMVKLNRNLGSYAEVWDGLSERLFCGHPMLTSAFVNGLLQYFGDGSESLFVLGDPDAPDAMAILRHRTWWHMSTFRPAQAQIGLMLIRDAATRRSLIEILPARSWVLDLTCLDSALTEDAIELGCTVRQEHALTMTIRLDRDFAAYWAARPRSLRQNLRRHQRLAIVDSLASRRVQITRPRDIASAVDRYALLEFKGWKGISGTALAPNNVQTAFYKRVLTDAASRGEAEVHELWMGTTMAASRLVIRRGDCLVMLKTTYDESLARYSPGWVLLHDVVADAFERYPGGSIEFYTNATRGQLAWATHARSIKDVRLFRHIAVAIAVRSLQTLRRTWHKTPRDEVRKVEVELISNVSRLPHDVRILFDTAAGHCGTQLGLDWFAALAEHIFGDGSDVCFFVLRHDGAVVAVLPMVAATLNARRAQALSNYYTALFSPVIEPWLRASDLVPLIQAVRRRWAKAGSLTLAPMDPLAREFVLVRSALESAGLVAFKFFRFANWSLPCEGLSWADYLASRDGALRNTISRMSRKLRAEGGELEIVCGGDRLEPAIRAYERVYAASWKKAEPHSGFMPSMMKIWAEHGWLRIGLAWLGDHPIAAQCWIVANGRAEIFKLAHDENFKRFSAGTLLTAHMMEHVLTRDGVHIVDYLMGDDAYKATWMTRRQERWGIVAYDPRRASGLVGLVREIISRSIKRHSVSRTASPAG